MSKKEKELIKIPLDKQLIDTDGTPMKVPVKVKDKKENPSQEDLKELSALITAWKFKNNKLKCAMEEFLPEYQKSVFEDKPYCVKDAILVAITEFQDKDVPYLEYKKSCLTNEIYKDEEKLTLDKITQKSIIEVLKKAILNSKQVHFHFQAQLLEFLGVTLEEIDNLTEQELIKREKEKQEKKDG